MKKIFAIALAVVMVLSMASAFAASDCFVWGKDWPCAVEDNTPWCGQGSVEIVPLVKVNTACGWEFQVSDCATAIRSEEVYYAVKLTVDAYPDKDWWTEANLFIDDEDFGFDRSADTGLNFGDWDLFSEGEEVSKIDMTAKKEISYYALAPKGKLFPGFVNLDSTTKAYKTASDALGNKDGVLDLKDVAIKMNVKSSTLSCGESFPEYELCATLSSFYDGGSVQAYNKLGDYEYVFRGFTNTFSFADMDEVEDATPSAFDGVLVVVTRDDNGDVANRVEFTVVEGAIANANWNFPELKDNDKFYLDVMEDFGFAACGTAPCVTFANIQANFGWNDAQTDCFDWSDKGASVVDTDCVVAIPKTGDASVLAWLF